MKHILPYALLIVALCFSSCSQLYNYVQVFEAHSSSVKNQEGGMIYEDENCVIHYSFWANGGNANFSIYNKSNEIISINPSKSFFIRNEVAKDYYDGQSIIAIPPHASRVITTAPITTDLLLDCDLNRYPEEQATITYDETNSPLRFTNYISYRIGENANEKVIENKFYVAKITNYVRPLAFTFVERPKRPCQNLTSDDSSNYKDTYPTKVYDIFCTFESSNCFYLEYKKWSTKRLYKSKGKQYFYNESYDGYTTVESEEDSEYRQRLLHPFAKP